MGLPSPDISTSSKVIEFWWICEPTKEEGRKGGRKEGDDSGVSSATDCASPRVAHPIPLLPKDNWLITKVADYVTQVIGYARAGSKRSMIDTDGEKWLVKI